MKIKEKWVSWEEFDLLFPGMSPTSTVDFGRVGGLLPGSIPFADATGMLVEYNSALFFDEANVRLGVGTGGPVCTGHFRSAVCADYAGIHPGTVLLLENDDHVTLQFQCATDGEARIRFCDDDFNPSAGMIDYQFADDELHFGVATSTQMYLSSIGLGLGLTPTNPLHVAMPGTDEGGLAGNDEVVARFRNSRAAHHTAISIDALTGYDPTIYLAENGEAQWDIRNDASESDEFQIRYQGRAIVNRTDFKIDTAGNIEISTGNLSIRNQNEFRFYDNGNYVGFEAPALTANQIWVLPDEDGDADDFLQTDGAGNLSWAPGGGGAATFIGLPDTPVNYIGQALNALRCNGPENALEWFTIVDQYVKVDGAAAPGYLGVAAGDGVLRTTANITVTDGGNFITLDTVQDIGTGDSPVFAGLTVTNILFYDLVDYNFVYGSGSGLNLTGGSAKTNVFMGYECGKEVTTGDYNVAFGHQALWRSQTGVRNVAIGYRALYGTGGQQGSSNTAIGYQALQSAYGVGNFGLGSGAGIAITSGTYNVCIGQSAGAGISTGHQNVAIGGYCLGSASGSYNTCVGPYSGRMLTGTYNVAFGREALRYGTSVANSVAIGRYASYRNVEGDENVMIGYSCGHGSGAGVDYHDNVGIGSYALFGIGEQGNQNVAIGWEAGYSISTGQGNVCLGYRAGKTHLTTDSNELWIANSDTATPLIYGEFPNALLKVQATNFNFIGTCNLGDGGVTNYASIATDGTVTLVGTARVTKKLFLNNAAFTKGASAPTQEILGNFNGWEFDINDDAVMTIMMPDDWDSTTDITIKVCWYIDEAYAADKEVQWRADWSAIPHDFSEPVDAPTHSGQIDSGDIDIPAVAKRMGASTIGTIVAANLSAGDMLGFTLSRIAVTHDDPTAKPTVHNLIIEYTSNKIGT